MCQCKYLMDIWSMEHCVLHGNLQAQRRSIGYAFQENHSTPQNDKCLKIEYLRSLVHIDTQSV